MIGIAFGFPTEFEQTNFGIPDEVRFARIEIGENLVVSDGRRFDYFWRKWELPLDERNKIMTEVLKEIGHRPHEISGFTLFYQSSVYTKADGTKSESGFQMSIRRKGEDGWDVSIIPEEQAMAVFRLLENTGHPDGPWKLTDDMRADVRDSFIVPQSAVEGWPKKQPVPDDGDVFEVVAEEGPSLIGLLDATGEACRGVNASLATLIAVLP
jgi:hypothetical protein